MLVAHHLRYDTFVVGGHKSNNGYIKLIKLEMNI